MQMTVTRALAELKTLSNRIAQAQAQTFVTLGKGKSEVPTVKQFKDKAEAEKTLQASFQSVRSLMTRRAAIKEAIVASNASTIVNIGTKSMTVAQAIERKGSIQFDKELLASMRSQLARAETELTRNDQEIEAKVEAQLVAMAGGQQGHKVDADQQKVIRQGFEDSIKLKLLDPIGIRTEIEKLNTSIAEFELEVDHVLSESNALTKIEIAD